MNILLRMQFDGGAYHGFQVQANAPTVCAALQNAMQALFGARPDVKGCARTDAGVHARDFCVSFHSDTAIPLAKLPLALNSHLPDDIRVFAARQVDEDFHARYSVQWKEYQYFIHNAPVDDPFFLHHAYRENAPLDEDAMRAAATHLQGEHDFAAFMAAGSAIQQRAEETGTAPDTVRKVLWLEVDANPLPGMQSGQSVCITVAANGFLYNMVRIIAGTLLQVGAGRMLPDALPAVIAGKDRALAGPTLPAKGLFLNRVFYPQDRNI